MRENRIRISLLAIGSISPGRRRASIIALLLMTMSFTASGYGGNVAMPARLSEIGGISYYAVNSSFSMLGIMLSLPLAGVISDWLGKKTVALLGMTIQLVARMSMMFIGTPLLLVLVSFLSNIGTGLYCPMPFSMIVDVVKKEDKPVYYGWLSAFTALGSLCGPLLTGYIMDIIGTGSGFIAYAPFALLSMAFLVAFFPYKHSVTASAAVSDYQGILLLVSALACMVSWLSLGGKIFAWLSIPGLILLCSGVFLFILLLKHENNHPNPAVPIYLFRKKKFATAFVCMMLLASYSTAATGFGMVFAQQVMQISIRLSSSISVPQTVIQAIASVFVGRALAKNFARRFRPLALTSLLAAFAATMILMTLHQFSTIFVIYTATALGGISLAISQTAFVPFFQSELKDSEYVAAQGLYGFGTTGGSSLFAAFAGALLNTGYGYRAVFSLAAAFCLLALCIGLAQFKFSPTNGGGSSVQ